MRYDAAKVKNWISSKEYYLPGIAELIKSIETEVLIIGATVFELYEHQGWINKLSRRTGDIDLSVGLVGDDAAYVKAKDFLFANKYKRDERHPYRFHPEKTIPGGYAYIDLLAHPQDQEMASVVAQNAMGVGPGFLFESFRFAKIEHYQLEGSAIFPNAFGFIALKIASYKEEPIKRLKDFADIVELINGLVETGTHFDITALWGLLRQRPESNQINEALRRMLDADEIGLWELDKISIELVMRNFDGEFVETTLRQRISDFLDQLS